MTSFIYKSYNFIDKDPIIDYLRTPVQESGMTYKAIADASGVSRQTIYNMLDGKTLKPQAATINAILRTVGHKLAVRPLHEIDAVSPTVVMKPPASVRHVVQIAKYRGLKKAKARRAGNAS